MAEGDTQFGHSFSIADTVEGQVARDAAEASQAALSTAEIGRLSRLRPVNPDVQVAYLKARHHLGKNSHDGFHQGLQCLHAVLEKDPTHAPAYAHMALRYSLLGFGGTCLGLRLIHAQRRRP